jgi:hypothetical protein
MGYTLFFMSRFAKSCRKIFALIFIFSFSTLLYAQDLPIQQQKRIYFPYPMDRNWQTSVGFTATTMPYEITEEIHFRVPAGDFHVLRKLGDKTFLDGRINFQVVQNILSLGPRWATPVSKRTSLALGADMAYWFGVINTQGLKTKGSGWQTYPNLSFGYRFNKAILLTLRAEAIMNLGIKTYAGDAKVATDYRLFSGSAYSVILEQPFYGKKSLSLGFRAIYSNFFWQTWTLFEPFDRNLFFPQVIVGLIL